MTKIPPNLGVGEKEITIWGLQCKANYAYLVSLERSWQGLLLGVKQNVPTDLCDVTRGQKFTTLRLR